MSDSPKNGIKSGSSSSDAPHSIALQFSMFIRVSVESADRSLSNPRVLLVALAVSLVSSSGVLLMWAAEMSS